MAILWGISIAYLPARLVRFPAYASFLITMLRLPAPPSGRVISAPEVFTRLSLEPAGAVSMISRELPAGAGTPFK